MFLLCGVMWNKSDGQLLPEGGTFSFWGTMGKNIRDSQAFLLNANIDCILAPVWYVAWDTW